MTSIRTARPDPRHALKRTLRVGLAVSFAIMGALLSVPRPASAAPGLTFVDAVFDGTGLEQLQAAAMSPDGGHVYAVGFITDGYLSGMLGAFERDPASGELTFIEAYTKGADGVDGIDSPRAVLVSPDGAHVYVAGTVDGTIALFERDAGSGRLTFLDVVRNGENGVNGIFNPGFIASSPDGSHLYVAGAVSPPFPSIPAVAVFARDQTSGALAFVEAEIEGVGGLSPSPLARLAVSPDGAHVYVASAGEDAVSAFARDPVTGALTFIESQQDGQNGVDGLAGVGSLLVSPDGAYLYSTSASEDSIAVFSRDASTGGLSFVETLRDGVDGVDGLDGVVALSPTADGSQIYVKGRSGGREAVSTFSRDATTGLLTLLQVQRDIHFEQPTEDIEFVSFSGAWSILLSPDDAHVYVPSTDFEAVNVLARETVSGLLSPVQLVRSGEGGIQGLEEPISMAVSPDGAHVYVTTLDDTLGVFARELATGALTFVEFLSNGWTFGPSGGVYVGGLETPLSVAVSPDGGQVYVASVSDEPLAVFTRAPDTGRLTLLEIQRNGENGVEGLEAGASAVALSPEGAHVYATAFGDSLAVFARDPITGALTFVEAERDGEGGVDGIASANSVIVSPDGAHVYVGGDLDDAVAIFARDAGSGGLTFVDVVRNGVGGVDGIASVLSLASTPDGSHLYVASGTTDAVAVFGRDSTTGALTHVQTVRYLSVGDTLLWSLFAIGVSTDGSQVFVTYMFDDVLAVFTRDSETGALDLLEIHQEFVDGVYGIRAPRAIASSPDGSSVYVAGGQANALALFRSNSAPAVPSASPGTLGLLALTLGVAAGALLRRRAAPQPRS